MQQSSNLSKTHVCPPAPRPLPKTQWLCSRRPLFASASSWRCCSSSIPRRAWDSPAGAATRGVAVVANLNLDAFWHGDNSSDQKEKSKLQSSTISPPPAENCFSCGSYGDGRARLSLFSPFLCTWNRQTGVGGASDRWREKAGLRLQIVRRSKCEYNAHFPTTHLEEKESGWKLNRLHRKTSRPISGRFHTTGQANFYRYKMEGPQPRKRYSFLRGKIRPQKRFPPFSQCFLACHRRNSEALRDPPSRGPVARLNR